MPRKAPPFIPFFPDVFLSDERVAAMTTEQVGAYMLLLCVAWGSTPPATIPVDPKRQSSLVRIDVRRWMKVRGAVLSCWVPHEVEDRLVQPRLLQEYEYVQNRRSRLSEAGRRGGLASAKSRSQAQATLPSNASSHAAPRLQPPSSNPTQQKKKNPPLASPPTSKAQARLQASLRDPTDPVLPDDFEAVDPVIEKIQSLWPKSSFTKPKQDRHAIWLAWLLVRDKREDAGEYLIQRAQAYVDANAGSDHHVEIRTFFNEGMYDVVPDEKSANTNAWANE